jgi:hypothetical protein
VGAEWEDEDEAESVGGGRGIKGDRSTSGGRANSFNNEVVIAMAFVA